eukprot:3999337-Pyramimonas_sp.AAC.1
MSFGDPQTVFAPQAVAPTDLLNGRRQSGGTPNWLPNAKHDVILKLRFEILDSILGHPLWGIVFPRPAPPSWAQIRFAFPRGFCSSSLAGPPVAFFLLFF